MVYSGTIKPVVDPGDPVNLALRRTIICGYDDLYRLTREPVVEDDEATVETKLDVTFVCNIKVANRDGALTRGSERGNSSS